LNKLVNEFEIISVNISPTKGTSKTPVDKISLRPNYGIIGDAHAGQDTKRQISLLAWEDILQMQEWGLKLTYGSLAENITTKGIDLPSLPIGTRLFIGQVILQLTQIGKKCHQGCAIYRQIGRCIMPTRGVFARVIKGGEIYAQSIGRYYL